MPALNEPVPNSIVPVVKFPVLAAAVTSPVCAVLLASSASVQPVISLFSILGFIHAPSVPASANS